MKIVKHSENAEKIIPDGRDFNVAIKEKKKFDRYYDQFRTNPSTTENYVVMKFDIAETHKVAQELDNKEFNFGMKNISHITPKLRTKNTKIIVAKTFRGYITLDGIVYPKEVIAYNPTGFAVNSKYTLAASKRKEIIFPMTVYEPGENNETLTSLPSTFRFNVASHRYEINENFASDLKKYLIKHEFKSYKIFNPINKNLFIKNFSLDNEKILINQKAKTYDEKLQKTITKKLELEDKN
jgi:hypothetical protein